MIVPAVVGTGQREAWARYSVGRRGLGGFKSHRVQGKVGSPKASQVTRARRPS